MGTKEEQEHFRKFYNGTFLLKGWKARMEEILGHVESADRDTVRDRLEQLGERIGREWVRDNSVRRIDTSMLQKWGDRLKSSRKKGSDSLITEIGEIEIEVGTILA